MPYGDRELGQHWLRYCLVAWRHQAITWTNVDLSSVRSCGFHEMAISQEMPQSSITKICLKITCQKFHTNFPGVNELIPYFPDPFTMGCAASSEPQRPGKYPVDRLMIHIKVWLPSHFCTVIMGIPTGEVVFILKQAPVFSTIRIRYNVVRYDIISMRVCDV